jgi:Tfp pilus assembly protein PilF
MRAALVAAAIVLQASEAANAQEARPIDVYRGVLAVYVSDGDMERAVLPLQQWTPRQYEDAIWALLDRGNQFDSEAAAILHLEFGVAATNLSSAAQHFDFGARIIRVLADRFRKAGAAPPPSFTAFAATWYTVAGSVFLALNDVYRARPFFREAMKIDRRSPAAQTLLAAADELELVSAFPDYASMRPRPDVRRRQLLIVGMYQQAIEFDPKYAPAHLRLARIHMSLGDLTLARSAIEEAIALAKEPAHKYLAALQLGAIVQRQGDLTAARAAYERALAVVPISQTATVALGHLDILEGRPDRAQARARAFLAKPEEDTYWFEFKNGGFYREGLVALRQRVRK